jgi:hypothetical protein
VCGVFVCVGGVLVCVCGVWCVCVCGVFVCVVCGVYVCVCVTLFKQQKDRYLSSLAARCGSLTFCKPCIVIHLHEKDQQDAHIS